MKLAIMLGTRPEIIKMSPIIHECERQGLDYYILHTGQHYSFEMDKVFFDELKLPPVRYNLDVGSGTHGRQTAKMLSGIEEILVEEAPDMVLVEGDTNTVLAGALAASKLHIKVGHVEAGLRSFNMNMPEEVNRILTDRISNILFCPTETAISNLKNEGFSDDKFFLVGDTMVEACLQNYIIAQEKSNILEKLGVRDGFILATVHRAETVDDKTSLQNVVDAFISIDEQIVFPVHPRTLNRLKEFGLYDELKDSGNVLVIEPLRYFDFLMLISKAKLILTDSGGIQKEAFLLGTLCVTLRDKTEWVETVDLGCNILVGSGVEKIIVGVEMMMNREFECGVNPFGDEKASERIVEVLAKEIS